MCVTYVILLSFLGLAIHSQAQNCPAPVAGANMKLKDNFSGSQTFQDGDTVSFECDLGYTPAGGSSSITCTAGSWTPLRMNCEKRNCGSAGEVANGEIDYSEGTEFGAKIVVTCNTGYRLVGKNTIFCGVQGWMDRLPECEVVICYPPSSVGAATFRPIKETYDYGDVVQYNCPKDYTLAGSKSLSCSEDATFKPAPPTCVNVECDDPNISDATWVEGSRPPHKYKSTVTYDCNTGYTMTGARTQTCELDGQWSPGLPTCKPVQCGEPKIPYADRVDGSQPPYKYKSTVTFKCISGYAMTGLNTQTCETSGQWSPGPTCKLIPTTTQPSTTETPRAVQCGEPKIPYADRVDGSQPPYKYKSTVTFKCISGYAMTGLNTQTCETSGQWSPGPTCKLIPTTAQPSTTKTPRAVQCGEPKIPYADRVDGSQPPYKYKSTVTFKCISGYAMTGLNTQTCETSGQWSPGPTCKLIPTTTQPSTTKTPRVHPGSTDSPPPGNNGNGKAIGLGVGLTFLIVVLTICGCYFCGVPEIIKAKRRSWKSSPDTVVPKEEEVALA